MKIIITEEQNEQLNRKIKLTVEELRCVSISIRKFHTQTYQLHWNVSWNQDSFDNYFLE